MTANVQVGDQLPELSIKVTRNQVVRYAGAATDFNPIHYSDRAAQQVGLPGVVAHGMWTMGAALRIVTDWIGDPAAVVNYFVRFTSPLAVPDTDEGVTLEVRATVSAIDDDLVTIAIEATSQGTKILGAAKAQVRLP